MNVECVKVGKFYIWWSCVAVSALLSLTTAQSLDVATRLTPWPPEGWPEGAQGEVKLVTDKTDEDVGLTFPVGENGEVTYRLPETLPRRANKFFAPLELSDLTMCDEVSPTLTPADADVLLLTFRLYADGEPWGWVEIAGGSQDLLEFSGENIGGVYYAKAPLRVGGSGNCLADPMEVVYDLNLQTGRNLLYMSYTISPEGTAMTMTTSETIELPSSPVGP